MTLIIDIKKIEYLLTLKHNVTTKATTSWSHLSLVGPFTELHILMKQFFLIRLSVTSKQETKGLVNGAENVCNFPWNWENEWEWKVNTNFTVHQTFAFNVKRFKIYGTQLFPAQFSISSFTLHWFKRRAWWGISFFATWNLSSFVKSEAKKKLII